MLQNVLFSTVAFRMKRSHFKTEDIENNRFFSDVYRSNISITNIVPQRRKSALTLVCLVAPISWKKNSLYLHQDVRPLTQVLASYYHFNLSAPPPPTHTKKIRTEESLKRLTTTNKETHPNKQFLPFLAQWLCSQGLQPDEPFLMLSSCLDEGQGPYGRYLSRLWIFLGSTHQLHPQSHVDVLQNPMSVYLYTNCIRDQVYLFADAHASGMIWILNYVLP